MADNVENLVLEQLRLMRADMEAMRSDMGSMREDMDALRRDVRGDMREGFAGVNGRIDGLVLMTHLLATHVHHIEERVERLEAP